MNDQALEQLERAREQLELDREQSVLAAGTKGGWHLNRSEPGRYVAARDFASSRQYEHSTDLAGLIDRIRERTRVTGFNLKSKEK